MRIALVGIVAALLWARDARADCGCGANLLTTRVAQGTATLVYAAGCNVKNLGMTLRAGGTTTKTKLVKTLPGSDSAQFVFEPEQPLAPGAYEVVVSGLVEQPYEKQILTVVKPGTVDLAWPADPKVTAQELAHAPCGPVHVMRIKVGTQAPLAFVELVDVASKTTAAAYVLVENGEINIGRGMCGGMFKPVKGREYTASITMWSPTAPTTSSVKALSVRYTPK